MKIPEYTEIWGHGYGNKIRRLAQGMKERVEGTNTMHFIHRHEVPRDRLKNVMYGKINCNYREGKVEQNRVRLTKGGDRINYPGDVGTPTSDLLTVKVLINIVISNPGVAWFTMDTRNFYLNTAMARKEYLRPKLSGMPDNAIEEYGLRKKATTDGYVYVADSKGMYGLP